MRAATRARGQQALRRLAILDPEASGARLGGMEAFPRFLSEGDLIVVNYAAALPGSLRVVDEALEVRLMQRRPDGRWDAVVLGAGDWRTATEHRPAPRPLVQGETLALEGGLTATVESLSERSPRQGVLRFQETGAGFWRGLYRGGRPIQYAHLEAALELWDVQTAYADRPWAAEAPSAGFALGWELLLSLRRRGVAIARVTEACGLSSSGDEALDRALPLTERYEIPPETLEAIRRTRARSGRVIAIGTSVVRALETWSRTGARSGWTTLRIGPGERLLAVDGILSGMHASGESHHALLSAFAPAPLLDSALALAERAGFLAHEFGDAMLILPGALRCEAGRGRQPPLSSARAREAMALSGCCLSTASSA